MLEGKISVIMPAYNESRHIEANVRETVRTLEGMGYDYEVIIVDDGSVDGTYLHALRVASTHPERVRVAYYAKNQGKGNALICGAALAKGDWIAFLDADMDLHPEQLPVLLEILTARDADVVVGSKRHPLSNVNYPRIRRIYSATYFAIIKVLFGLPLRDTQTGLKIFRATVLRDVFPRVLVKRFAFDIEVLGLAHRYGYKIVDAPVTLNFTRGHGRIKLHDVWDIALDTLAIFYRMRIRRYYDSIDVPESASYAHHEVSSTRTDAERDAARSVAGV